MAVIDVVLRRAGIVEEIHRTLKAGDEAVDLGRGGVHALPLVTKNGSPLTLVTHYTWNTYASYLTLVTPAADGDEMYIQAQRVFSTTYVQDIIDEAHNLVIYPALRTVYDVDDLPTSPTVQALAAAYATGRLRQDMTKGATLEDPVYRSGWELVRMVQDAVKAIQAGSAGISDAAGDELANLAGSFVGSFIHPGGPIEGRLGAVDRAQRWLGRLEPYWPEIKPTLVTDARGIDAEAD